MIFKSGIQRVDSEKEQYLARQAALGNTIENSDDVKAMVEYYDKKAVEYSSENSKWGIDNLEYDLRMSAYIVDKCKDKLYSQHLYAALCNNDFIKNEPWPILQEIIWSCTWRSAGGIVAAIRSEGDYMDWYCSGIVDCAENEGFVFDDLREDQKQAYKEKLASVAEGIVTDEIKKDLLKIGWLVKAGDGTRNW
jgi:hypothetical protein